MEEEIKKIMGESYKENMTSDEIQNFFKNQVLGDGKYVNKDMAEAEKRKLQDELNTAKNELKNKMTDEEKKEANSKELQKQLEDLKAQILQGNIEKSEYQASSLTAKTRLKAGIEDDDEEFKSFIKNISSDNVENTSKIANYINLIAEKAYEKGKTDAVKNKLGNMGNGFKDGEQNGDKTNAEEIAERLAKSNLSKKETQSYFN